MSHPLFDNFKLLFSSRRFGLFTLFFAICCRLLQLLYFYNIRLDMSFQITATKNFVEGHGISLDTVSATDLSQSIYTPLINWPPGFSILFSPFYLLAGKNYLIAGLALSFIAGVTLIFVTRALLRLYQLPVFQVNLYTLTAGLFIYPFYFIASSDAVMVCIFFIALYYTISLLKNNRHWLLKSLGITICLFACAAIKYLFVPAAFVIPSYIFFRGYFDKNSKWKKAGIVSFTILLLLTLSMLGYQYGISQSVGYISAQGRGFFPSHLLAAYPMIPGAFINTETFSFFFANDTLLSLAFILFQIINIAFLTFAGILIIKRIFRKGLKDLPVTADFFYITFFISVCILMLLALLSIRVEKELWNSGYRWTYIEDARYYGVPIVLAQLGLFIGYHHIRQQAGRIVILLLLASFVLLFIETGRGLIFSANRVKNFGTEIYSWQSEYRLQQYADSLLNNEKIKNPENLFVVAGTHSYFNIRIGIYSQIPLLDKAGALNSPAELETKKNTTILAAMEQKKLPSFQPFLSSPEIKFAGHLQGINFYFLTVYAR